MFLKISLWKQLIKKVQIIESRKNKGSTNYCKRDINCFVFKNKFLKIINKKSTNYWVKKKRRSSNHCEERERERDTWMGVGSWGTSEAFSNGLDAWLCRTCLPNQAFVPQTQQKPVQTPQDLLVIAIASSSFPLAD